MLSITFSNFRNFNDIWKKYLLPPFHGNVNLISKILLSLGLILSEKIGLSVRKSCYRWYLLDLGLQSIPFSLFVKAKHKNSFALYKLTIFDWKMVVFLVCTECKNEMGFFKWLIITVVKAIEWWKKYSYHLSLKLGCHLATCLVFGQFSLLVFFFLVIRQTSRSSHCWS